MQNFYHVQHNYELILTRISITDPKSIKNYFFPLCPPSPCHHPLTPLPHTALVPTSPPPPLPPFFPFIKLSPPNFSVFAAAAAFPHSQRISVCPRHFLTEYYYCIAKAMRSKIFNFPTQPITGQNMKLPQTWVIKPTFQSYWVSYSHQKFVFDGCVYDFFSEHKQRVGRQKRKIFNIRSVCPFYQQVGKEKIKFV